MSEKLGDLYRKRVMDAPEREDERDEDDKLAEKPKLGDLFKSRVSGKKVPRRPGETVPRNIKRDNAMIGTRG